VARGQTEETIRFDDAFIERLAINAMLRYLAIAHYGRGRGAFVESEAPVMWCGMIEAALAERRAALASILALRAPDCEAQALVEPFTRYLRDTTRAVLDELYPGVLARHRDEPLAAASRASVGNSEQ
jgi:hypothetical protein